MNWRSTGDTVIICTCLFIFGSCRHLQSRRAGFVHVYTSEIAAILKSHYRTSRGLACIRPSLISFGLGIISINRMSVMLHCNFYEMQSDHIFSYNQQGVSNTTHLVKHSLITSCPMTNSESVALHIL